jgi:hypothetical protein
VQSGDDEHMVRRGLLKCGDDFGIHEAAVAEEHGAQDGVPPGLTREQRVEPVQQRSASSCQALQQCRAWTVDRSEQFAAAERTGQIDLLTREKAAQIERAGIKEIARRTGFYQSLDAIARTQELEFIRCMRIAVQARPQPARYGQNFAGLLNLIEIDFVTASPGQRYRVFAQASAPAERIAGVEPAGGQKTRHVFGGNSGALEAGCSSANDGPREERDNPCRGILLPPEQKCSEKNRESGGPNPKAKPSGPSLRELDAGREGR